MLNIKNEVKPVANLTKEVSRSSFFDVTRDLRQGTPKSMVGLKDLSSMSPKERFKQMSINFKNQIAMRQRNNSVMSDIPEKIQIKPIPI